MGLDHPSYGDIHSHTYSTRSSFLTKNEHYTICEKCWKCWCSYGGFISCWLHVCSRHHHQLQVKILVLKYNSAELDFHLFLIFKNTKCLRIQNSWLDPNIIKGILFRILSRINWFSGHQESDDPVTKSTNKKVMIRRKIFPGINLETFNLLHI